MKKLQFLLVFQQGKRNKIFARKSLNYYFAEIFMLNIILFDFKMV
jgi:hypothetical protein